MITPTFRLWQDYAQIKITIHAPYTKIKDTEITVLDENFYFHSKPYYLRLTFPGKIQESDNSSAKFLSDESEYVILLDKVTPGEDFPNLDLLSTFLQPNTKKSVGKPLIQDISDPSDAAAMEDVIEEEEWSMPQYVEEDMPMSSLLNQYKYGFANSHSGLGTKYEVELGEVADIRDPDSLSPLERTEKREEIEREKFSDDHYLADLNDNDNDEISAYLAFELNVRSLQKLTKANQDQLKHLGNREFLLDKNENKRLYLGLIDILFAYCYDWRVTLGDHCVETPWNISRISATLSWFEVFESIRDVVRVCLRRSLTYPICRNWNVSAKAFQDTTQVLRSGKTGILICLLDILRLFNSKDPYYLHNQLYIEQYCIWVQQTSDFNITSMITALEKTVTELTKSEVGLDLCELEIAAKATEDEEMFDDMSSDIANVRI